MFNFSSVSLSGAIVWSVLNQIQMIQTFPLAEFDTHYHALCQAGLLAIMMMMIIIIIG